MEKVTVRQEGDWRLEIYVWGAPSDVREYKYYWAANYEGLLDIMFHRL
jgi:hypothetical protein